MIQAVMEECGRKFLLADHTCRRLLNGDGSPHLGLHRNARTLRGATVVWGDNECAPDDRQEKTDDQ